MTGFACWVLDCGGEVALQWSRRPTAEEVAATVPPGVPIPDPADSTWAVHACLAHGLTGDLAALVHQAGCRAVVELLPGCGCVPEKPPYMPLGPAAGLV